jgi:signal transduction histidine kinase
MDASRILDLVDELLDFSLLESEHLKLNLEKVDLARVITDVLQLSQEQANAKQVSLLSAPMDSALVADVDPARMQRVLSKLVDNAIKFSEKDDKVLVTGKSMNDKIIINVIDEGCGISLEDSNRIFEKYAQFSHTLDINIQGMGLGLYTSRQILEAHGGTLTVSSQLGAGSTFTISIPVMKTM